MTPPEVSLSPDMLCRARLLGLLTTQDLCALFGVCDDTISRAWKDGRLPPPLRMFGKCFWSTDILRQHLTGHAALLAEAEREQQKMATKVQALYGGESHGRRL